MAWNHIWLASSLLDFIKKPDDQMKTTPKEMVIYCAIMHFLEKLPLSISFKSMKEIYLEFKAPMETVSEAEVL
jgi:hypothetical protein